MVVALTRTVGKHYKASKGSETALLVLRKALPELDDFLLRILDMSIPLLDAEWGGSGRPESSRGMAFHVPRGLLSCH